MSARARVPAAGAAGVGGFTLLEVMAAIAVFMVGILGVIGLLTSGTVLHQESQNLIAIDELADEVLLLSEREIADRVHQVKDALPEPAPPRPVPSRPAFSYAWRLAPAADQGLFLLSVDVTFAENGKTRKTTFERVLPRLASAASDARALLTEKRK